MKSFLSTLSVAIALLASAEAQTPLEGVEMRILSASTLSMPEFEKALTTLNPTALLPPNPQGPTGEMASVRDGIVEKVKSMRWVIQPSDKEEQMKALTSLCGIHAWCVKAPAYSNFVLASNIEGNVAMTALAALVEGVITVQEAKALIAGLGPYIAADELVKIVASNAPASIVVSKFKKTMHTAHATPLLDLAEELSEERDELLDGRLSSMFADVRPASLISSVIGAACMRQMVGSWISYSAKGGKFLPDSETTGAEFGRICPDAIHAPQELAGVKLSRAMYEGVLENAREWKNRRPPKK